MSEQLPAITNQSGIIGDARVHVVPTLIAVAGERAVVAQLTSALRGRFAAVGV